MSEVAASIEVAVGARTAWERLTDWESQGEWMIATVVRKAGERRFLARTGLGPLRIDDVMEIEIWEPPRRVEVRHLGRLVRGRGIFRVEPLGEDRCRVTWQEVDQLPGAGLIRPFFVWSLRRFARQLEGRR